MMMRMDMRRIGLSFAAALVLSIASVARADAPAPDALIEETVREVLVIVKGDSGIMSNQKRLIELVDAKILPHFDFTRMTQLAVGRSWRTATSEQKQSLTTEFRTMLVRTYTKVFVNYPDPKVEVKPAKMEGGATEATVRTVIHLNSSKSATVDYEMEKTENGWKAFDVTVEGVSLVTSYRGSFADQIQQAGVDGLIKALADKNAEASRASSVKKATN